MRRSALGVLAGAVLGLAWAPAAGAVEIALWDWALYQLGGTTVYGESMPSNVDDSAFDYATGLGSVKVHYEAVTNFKTVFFVDHEIDEGTNGWFNEYGVVEGTPAAGEMFEIDEPGFFFGDDYANALTGALDGNNGVPVNSPYDVSMALGRFGTLRWNNEWHDAADVTFLLSTTAPPSGFFLEQVDPSSEGYVYFSSSIAITSTAVPDDGGQPKPVPESGTLVLLGSGLTALLGWRRRRGA